jgi:glycosyltransferase involved in cell wall biosynthesis
MDRGRATRETRGRAADPEKMTQPVGQRARISVVVPSYNSAGFLVEALESALSQEPPPHEVIVRDGGSTDGSVEILRTFGDRVQWRSEPDGGQAQALNMAIAVTTGDIVVWLNADDLLVPGAFLAVQQAYRDHPEAEFVYGDYDMIRADGSVMRRYQSSAYEPERVFTHGCYIFSGAMFFRRDLLERIGPFDERLHACMDLDYLLRIGDVRAVHLGTTVAKFRRSGLGKSSLIRGTFLREAHAVRKRAAGGSRRRRVVGLLVDARDLVALATEPLRYTRAWSAVRRSKRL